MRRILTQVQNFKVLRPDTEGMDRWLLLATGALLVIGTIAIYSATVTSGGGDLGLYYLLRHLLHIIIGLALAAAVWLLLPLRLLRKKAFVLTLMSIATLLLVHLPILGIESKGAARWLNFGVINVQPVEYTKLIILVFVCSYCASHREALATWRGTFPPLIVIALADLCLLLQPDFGSSVILTVLALTALFLAGASLWLFCAAAVVLIPSVVLLVVLFPYRMSRLMSFLDPFQDPYGGGYHQTHALMAFGKGGWFGGGLGQSVEKWSHLPEAHTDFIIAVLAEETGIIGVMVVLSLYALILHRSFVIAANAERLGNFFVGLLARVIGLMMMVQMAINIAGNLAIGPVKGLTLPLVSYGGSSLVTWLVTLALLQVLAHSNANMTAPARARFAPA